jgi:transposase-like protein
MEIKEALSRARSSVEEADLPEPWRASAFSEVLRHLLRDSAMPGNMAVEVPTRVPRSEAGQGLARLADRLGVPDSTLADIFDVEEDVVTLHVASSKISSVKSKATREIALLTVVARQGAGLDESWTDVSHVRDALNQYNRYDTSNFSKYLRDTDDVFNFKGRPVQLRLTRPGWEAATELVKTLMPLGQ